MNFSKLSISCFVSICLLGSLASADIIGLGDLPGGSSLSIAFGISADGTVVVGRSFSGNGNEAFRWTAAGGMTGLGHLASGTPTSQANAVSGNGSVVVGYGSAGEGFRHTAAGGMTGLGVLPGGSTNSIAHDVSDSGLVIVGRSGSALGDQAFRWTVRRTPRRWMVR